jgi:hypothetical protein
MNIYLTPNQETIICDVIEGSLGSMPAPGMRPSDEFLAKDMIMILKKLGREESVEEWNKVFNYV